MSAPALEALITYLSGISGVTDLVSTRIFGLELPAAQAASMPRNALVLSLAGGPEKNGVIDQDTIRIDSFAYGATPLDAVKVNRATQAAMETVGRTRNVVQSTVVMKWVLKSSGPISLKDPDGLWPVVVQTFLYSASETTV